MECGWSGSSPELKNDMNLLLVGSCGAVKRVFIVEWKKHSDDYHVSGFIEVFKLDRNGMPVQEGPTHVSVIRVLRLIDIYSFRTDSA